MLKLISFLLISIFVTMVACNSGSGDIKTLQMQVDRLQHQVDSAYRPGLGEFMSGIQVHHAKLWFAGSAANWKLADFEIGEIKEALDDIRQYCKDRPEVNSLPMIQPAVDSVSMAVSKSNQADFKRAFTLLTTTCNNCHRITKHEFNVIKIPDTPPFSNQVFVNQP
jgi:hypothetical protein